MRQTSSKKLQVNRDREFGVVKQWVEIGARHRLGFKFEGAGWWYAQTRHVSNITPPPFEYPVDDWITPKCENVLFEGDEDMSPFFWRDGALGRPRAVGPFLPLLSKPGYVRLPVGASTDGYLFGIRRVGEEFLG